MDQVAQPLRPGIGGVAAAICTAAIISACSAPGPKPEQQCSASSTAQGLLAVALNGTGVSPADVHLKLDSAVLDGVDRTTKRVTCSANFSLTFSGALAAADRKATLFLLKVGQVVRGQPVVGADTTLSSAQSYSIQPAADGSAYVYGLSGSAAAAIAAWAQAAKASVPAANAAASGDAASAGSLAKLRRACWKLEGGVQGETPAHPDAVTAAELGELAGDVLSEADGVPASALSDKDRKCVADAKQTPDGLPSSGEDNVNEDAPANQLQ